MPADLDFTGERFLPGVPGEIAYEHWHRYAFALAVARGRRVLDAACGEGYGSALLAGVAAQVTGVDVDAATVAHARAKYAGRAHLAFEQGSVAALPLPDASVDVVVSFETIEHLPAADQPAMLAEFARVLAADGVLVISSPNRRRYSDERDYRNPFHLHELYRDEFDRALAAHFPHRRWFHQEPVLASALWSEAGGGGAEAWVGDATGVAAMPVPDGMYYVVVAARSAAALPAAAPALSLFADRDGTELKRAGANAAEVLRLDALLGERTAALDRASAHVEHLEALVAVRDRLVVARDESAAHAAEHVRHLEQLVAEREALVVARDEAATQAAQHVLHLEGLVAERDRLVLARDAELAAVNAARADHERGLIAAREELQRAAEARAAGEARERAAAAELAARDAALAARAAELAAAGRELAGVRSALAAAEAEGRRLDAAVAAQERIIAYRQSVRWWLRLPFLRVKLAWQHLTSR